MERRSNAVQEDEIVLNQEPEPEKTWIEIELIDPNGKPVPNERYKLTLPDGSVKWGSLDDNGKARVERLQPGNCQVTFPDRDQEVWDVS
jgi:type VI secretion system secreted protein VgrG